MGSAAQRLHQRAQAHADHMAQTAARIAAEQEVERRYQERTRTVPLKVRYLPQGTAETSDTVRLTYDDGRTDSKTENSAWFALKSYAEVAVGEPIAVPPKPITERAAPPPAPPTRQEQIERDRNQNIAFYLWARDHFSEDPTDLEFDPWNEILAARALLRLVGWFPNGRGLLAGLYPAERQDEVPTVAAVQRFLLVHDLWGGSLTAAEQHRQALGPWTSDAVVHDMTVFDGATSGINLSPDLPPPVPHFVPMGLAREEQAFLAALYAEVPGSFGAIYRLLAAYKSQVRESWEASGKPADAADLSGLDVPERYVTWDHIVAALGLVLPDDLPPVDDLLDTHLERAVMRVLAGEPVKTVEHEEHVTKERIKAAMEERGLPYPRQGRPKKAA